MPTNISTNNGPNEYRGLYRVSNLPSSFISLADLKKLYRDLNIKKHEAFDKQFAELEKPSGQSEKQFDEMKKRLKEERDLTVMVYGSKGEQIVVNSINGLEESGLPESITAVTLESSFTSSYPNFKFLNRFTLRMDFAGGAGTYGVDPSVAPTPNNSTIEVIGPDATWVTAVYEDCLGFFRSRKRHREWLHGPLAFNLLSWVISFPTAFWLIYRIDSVFSQRVQNLSTILRVAICVYIAIISLTVFRIAVFGVRWMFPLVELEGARSKKVRGFLGTVISFLLLALLYDVLKTLFSPS